MKKILNIIKNILDISIVIMIVILTILVINNRINKENVTKIGDYYIFYVASGSMEPTLNIGDVIISKQTNDYEIDDIITYKIDNSYVTHRIIKIENEQIITQGDANQSEDKPITKNQIKCEYQKKSLILKTIYGITKSPVLMVLLVIIIILVNILDYLFESRREKEYETKTK